MQEMKRKAGFITESLILEGLGGVRTAFIKGTKTELCLRHVLLPFVVRIHFSFPFLESVEGCGCLFPV